LTLRLKLDELSITLHKSPDSASCSDETYAPYSFTTFVLPISYKLEQRAGGEPTEVRWRDTAQDKPTGTAPSVAALSRVRRKMERHFLPDSRSTLFDRAHWFRLDRCTSIPTAHPSCDQTQSAREPWHSFYAAFPEDWKNADETWSTEFDSVKARLREAQPGAPDGAGGAPRPSKDLRILKLAVDTPELVLFEFDLPHERGAARRSRDALTQHGFLLLTVRFVHYDAPDCVNQLRCTPRFGDLRWLNEIARCQHRGFSGHYDFHEALLYVDRILGPQVPEVQEKTPLATVGSFWGDRGELGLPKAAVRKDTSGQRDNDGPDPRDVDYLAPWESLLAVPLETSDSAGTAHGLRLFPDAWFDDARRALWNSDALADSAHRPSDVHTRGRVARRSDVTGTGWMVAVDNRAFVWSAAVLGPTFCDNGAVPNACATIVHQLSTNPPEDWFEWAGFVNVDRPGEGTSAENYLTSPLREIAKETTHGRWAGTGGYRGFAYHAGVALLPPETKSGVLTAWRHQHLARTLLQLYVRSVGHALRVDLSKSSATYWDAAESSHADRYAEQVLVLRRALAHVSNLYRFPLTSHAQQEMELHSLANAVYRIDPMFDAISQQIRATDEFLLNRHNIAMARTAQSLNKLAALFLIPALTIGLAQLALALYPGFAQQQTRSMTAAVCVYVLLWACWFALVLLSRFRRSSET